jgi:hypothetical protein
MSEEVSSTIPDTTNPVESHHHLVVLSCEGGDFLVLEGVRRLWEFVEAFEKMERALMGTSSSALGFGVELRSFPPCAQNQATRLFLARPSATRLSVPELVRLIPVEVRPVSLPTTASLPRKRQSSSGHHRRRCRHRRLRVATTNLVPPPTAIWSPPSLPASLAGETVQLLRFIGRTTVAGWTRRSQP